ncbi:TIGR04255 family protein [Rathayibacter sp. AY1C5]|uniref:TIGR04255 family protein n=1 Tax=Rathayibacter sp. AY1C5 TaxID=2080538 RepID=UPI000CE8BE9F|nr:TIGR04255 family protein [Rathayibacter sp. AY1C5]PPG61063.1 hypothetical protein C5C57_03040 [Rathayibacter sp. AY1C5]
MTEHGQSQPAPSSLERPPVVEVALGILFPPVGQLGFRVLGRLHDEWSNRYPVSREVAAVPYMMDVDDDFTAPPVRLWSESTDGSFVVQAQADRIFLNWRQVEGASTYPRWQYMLSAYLSVLSDFRNLCASQGIELPRPLEIEVTYVNLVRIDADEIWPDKISFLRPPEVSFPGEVQVERAQVMTEVEVTPIVNVSSSITTSFEPWLPGGNPRKEAVVTVLTRIHVFEAEDEVGVENAMHAAHQLANDTFKAATTTRAQSQWGMFK